MTLRRLAAGIPAAAVAALLVHVAATGFDHAPGLGQAPSLSALLGASLALAATVVFLRATLWPSRGSIATNGPAAQSLLALAGGAFACYLGLELLEGHGFAAALPALAASLPAAALVLRGARAAGAFLRIAGKALAAYAPVAGRAPALAFAVQRAKRQADPSLPAQRARRGRAPPRFA
jgi:hypothetical protein